MEGDKNLPFFALGVIFRTVDTSSYVGAYQIAIIRSAGLHMGRVRQHRSTFSGEVPRTVLI